jgi:hypothetical protein
MNKLLFGILVAILLLSACGKATDTVTSPAPKPAETETASDIPYEINFSDFDEVIIAYHLSKDEEDEVTITDSDALYEILEMYNSMSVTETSKPLDYPRYSVKFQKDGLLVSTWHISKAGLTSGSRFGLGNHESSNGKAVYNIFEERWPPLS